MHDVLQSNKFWKKFDSLALQFYKDFALRGSERFTREVTRGVLKFLHDNNLTNKTSVNHINDIWENVHMQFEALNVNEYMSQMIEKIIPPKPINSNKLQTSSEPSITNNTLRFIFEDLKKMPGIKQSNQLINMLIKSDCGKNLVVESLEEVGVIQYLEKARLGQLVTSPSINKTSIGSIRVDRGYEHQSFRIDEVLGKDVQLVVDWIAFSLVLLGSNYGWW